MRLLSSAFSFLPYLFESFHEPNCKSPKSFSYLCLNPVNFGLDVNITCTSIWLSWPQGSNWANSSHEAFGQPRKDAGHTCHSISYVWATSKCLENQTLNLESQLRLSHPAIFFSPHEIIILIKAPWKGQKSILCICRRVTV